MIIHNLLPIQALWIGDSLTNMEKLCILSFLKNGHPFHLYSYDAIKDVPPGAAILDANTILPASMIFQYKHHKSYAGFSNYFRYKLLLDKGGWWTDLDMVCVKSLDWEDDYVFAAQHENDYSERVTSGIIKAPAGCNLMRHLFNTCLSKDPSQIKWGETGPQLLHAAVNEFSLQQYIQPANTFCPIPYFRWTDLILPRKNNDFDESVQTVHLWNEMWRRYDADKNETYPSSSVFEKLKARYIFSA